MAYKLFSTGEVLTAANVNNYLMNQTVMVFASAAARTTALSGVLAEGMISYRSDAKVLEIYNGTTWVTESSFVSPLTTKGDVHTYSTTDARLPVGSDGQTLVANSSQTTGLGWSPLGMAGKNRVINGAMNIAQRGTTYALTNAVAYGSIDRWAFYQSGTANGIANQVASGLTGFQYAIKMGRNSGATTTGVVQGVQPFETANSVDLQGQVVTFSFYAKAGANFSAASNNITYAVYTGTGTDQSAISQAAGSWTGILTPILGTQAITTTWTRYSYTGTIASTATQVGVGMYYTPTGTAGADDNLYITGVQLELGSVASTFSRNATTIQGELAACQRYYYRLGGTTTTDMFSTSGFVYSATVASSLHQPPVPMRVLPTSIDSSNVQLYDASSTQLTLSAPGLQAGSTNTFVWISWATSGGTTGRFGFIRGNSTTSSYFGLSAEL